MADRREVLIVGAGVMGCATARELATRGVTVTVLERAVPGAEASSAAAGMLAAQLEAHAPGPFAEFCIAGREAFTRLAADLLVTTGIDIEYRRCGVLRSAKSQEELAKLVHEVAWQRDAGRAVRTLDTAQVRSREPHLAHTSVGGVLFEDDARVDPPQYLQALRIAAERAGAQFRSGTTVMGVVSDTGSGPGVSIEGGSLLRADRVVVCAGSWTPTIDGVPLPQTAIVPARGQIALLRAEPKQLTGIISSDQVYLCPRDDGRVLVGSTLEFVGFKRGVSAGAVAKLIGAATDLIPALAEAELIRCWSSFRPHTHDELPVIGESGASGIVVASGHFRNGILLSAITAQAVAAVVLGERPPICLDPFAASRLQPQRL